MTEDAPQSNKRDDRISFVTVDQVIYLHSRMIDMFSPGESLHIRDTGLLESAVMAPQQTRFGAYLYGSIAEMAGAYLIGLAQNHAFENGNKRVAFATCSTFLRMNGYKLSLTQDEAMGLTFDVVNHKIDRETLAAYLDKSLEPL